MKEREQIEEQIARHADTVYRVALLYMRHPADAEDIAQEAFLRLCGSEVLFREGEIVKAWLIRVTANLCKNELKRFWRTRVSAIDENYPCIEDPEKKELTDEVFRLPVKYRDVIYLHYYEGYTTDEIGALLGRKPATVRTQLKRGRQLLYDKLTKGGADIAETSRFFRF